MTDIERPKGSTNRPLIPLSDENMAFAEDMGVNPAIHENDFIFNFVDRLWAANGGRERAVKEYFNLGRYSAKLAKSMITDVQKVYAVAKSDWAPRRVLDFASGYGCTARHMGHVFADSLLATCDIHIDAVNFNKDVLGVESYISSPVPEQLKLPPQDVIFAHSFFSHMPETTWARWLKALANALAPRGVLIFTAYGFALDKRGYPGLKVKANGFGFIPQSEQDDPDTAEYGLTISYPRWVLPVLASMPDLRLSKFHEGLWWGTHGTQDTYVCVKELDRLPDWPASAPNHPTTPVSGASKSMPHMSPAAAEEYIASLYTTILKRDPGPEEFAHWVTTAGALPPEQVYFRFVNSDEYQRKQEKSVRTQFLPGHYHSPIVDPSTIAEYVEKQYLQEPDDIKGIHFDEDAMVRFWKENAEFIQNTPFSEHDDGKNRYYYDNGCYPYGDAIMLRAMIAHFKPKNVIEVGSGFSSACMLDAVDHAGLSDFTITCIDPDADRLRGRLREEDRSRVDIIEGLVQDVPVSTFSKLNENDILFIDSTHVLKTASDVHYELFSILPSLNKGVLIHFHDIQYPFEYPRQWLFEDNKSWNEIYALRAFLMYSSAFEVVFWNGLFARLQHELVDETNPLFLKNPGSSIWLRARSADIPQTQHAQIGVLGDPEVHTTIPAPSLVTSPMVNTPGAGGKRSLRGHVGRVDKFLIDGWALCEEEPEERPEIQFVQGGEVVITLRPCFPHPQLRAALNLPASPAAPTYNWRLWMPLANGLRPDVPFSIVFRENGALLALGESRRLEAMQSIDPAVRADLEEAVLFTPRIARLEDALDISVVVEKPIPPCDVTVKLFDQSETSIPQLPGPPSVLGKQAQYGSLRIPRSQLMAAPGTNLRIGVDSSEPGDSRSQFHSSLRSLWIPKAVFDASRLSAPLPDIANIHRVSGPTSDAFQYLVFGATTFHQLDLIARRHAGRPIADLGTVLDWGVGCGRVLRQIRESGEGRPGRTIGLDIDEVNVRWCAQNLAAYGDFGVLSLDGFELEERSVDFLYGISVMTHLTEHHQLLWLDQIRRILKPGGLAVLTVNGEGLYYHQPEALFVPFVERFGFFDGIADNAIGEDRSTYYRATYHTRSYIRQTWSRYFEIIDVIVMGHHFTQDYVVLRRPAG